MFFGLVSGEHHAQKFDPGKTSHAPCLSNHVVFYKLKQDEKSQLKY